MGTVNSVQFADAGTRLSLQFLERYLDIVHNQNRLSKAGG
jgi:hypothetical protein